MLWCSGKCVEWLWEGRGSNLALISSKIIAACPCISKIMYSFPSSLFSCLSLSLLGSSLHAFVGYNSSLCLCVVSRCVYCFCVLLWVRVILVLFTHLLSVWVSRICVFIFCCVVIYPLLLSLSAAWTLLSICWYVYVAGLCLSCLLPLCLVSLFTTVFLSPLQPISFLSRSLFSVICGSVLSMCLFAFLPVYSHLLQTLLLDSVGMYVGLRLCFLSLDGERWEIQGRGNLLCAWAAVYVDSSYSVGSMLHLSMSVDLCGCCMCVSLLLCMCSVRDMTMLVHLDDSVLVDSGLCRSVRVSVSLMQLLQHM